MLYETINDKYKVIAKINYNDKEYIYYTDNDNIGVGYFLNNKIKAIKDEEEAKLVCLLFNELKKNVSKHEYIDFGFTFYNNIKYKMVYDTNTKRRFFFEVGEDICKEATGEALEYLDKKFNSELEVLYEDGSNEPNKSGKKKNLSKRIKFAIFGGFCIAFAGAEIGVIDYILDQNYIIKLEDIDYTKDIKDTNQIKDLLNSNKNIDNDTKDFLLSLDNIYDDNYKYMDYAFLEKLLPDLKIVYATGKQSDYNQPSTIAGQYRLKYNDIIIFDNSKFRSSDYRTLLHEYVHTISYAGFAYDNPDGAALMEGLTELITGEYITTMKNEIYDGVYLKQQTYARMLFEIVGTKDLLEPFFKHDYNMLIKNLNKYTDNEYDSINLIRLINDEKKYEDEYTLYNKKIKDTNGELKSIQDKIDNLYKKFFLNAKGYELKEDKIMCTYMDQIRGTNTARFNQDAEMNVSSIDVQKFYVSKELKNDSALFKYNYGSGILVDSNPADFVKLDDGGYVYYDSDNNEIFYDEIPDQVLVKHLYNEIDEDTRRVYPKDYSLR